MAPTNSIVFVSDTTTLLPHAYGYIADLILAGRRNYIVGVAMATDAGVSLIGALFQPSAQALKQLKEEVTATNRDSSPIYESTAALAEAALSFASQLPVFDGAPHKELVIMSSNPHADPELAVDVVTELEEKGIHGYAVCTGTAAAIDGLDSPPWLLDEMSPPPIKTVSPVKTYDGMFTVGDPAKPLISVAVSCYPASRHALPITPSTFHGDHAAVSSYQMETSEGPPSRPEDVQRGFTYLSEMVTANTEVQKLMDGEFNGAENWPRAFELLATVPEVPPWIPLGGSDVVVGKDEAAVAFIAALHTTLKEKRMHAIARLSKGARGGRHKGALELSLLQPFDDGLLLRTALPYKEDFKSYYRFMEIPEQPSAGDESIDALTDELLLGMQVGVPSLPRNPAIVRTGEFIKGNLAYDSTTVPPVRPLTKPLTHLDAKTQSAELASLIGIAEQVQAPPATTEPSQDVSYQATQTEINIDDLL